MPGASEALKAQPEACSAGKCTPRPHIKGVELQHPAACGPALETCFQLSFGSTQYTAWPLQVMVQELPSDHYIVQHNQGVREAVLQPENSLPQPERGLFAAKVPSAPYACAHGLSAQPQPESDVDCGLSRGSLQLDALTKNREALVRSQLTSSRFAESGGMAAGGAVHGRSAELRVCRDFDISGRGRSGVSVV